MSTTYADPNSDVTYTWSDNAATDYTRVDDGVRDPSNPATGGDGQNCIAGDADDSEIATFGCTQPSISGTVTQVKVKVFAGTGGPTISTDIGAYFGGSTRTASSHSISSATWYTTTYSSLSIDAGSFYPCRINITPGGINKGDQLSVSGAYLEITYSSALIYGRTVTENLALFQFPGEDFYKFKQVDYYRSLNSLLSLATSLAAIESQTIQSRSLSETIGLSTEALTYYYITRLVLETIGFSTASSEEIQKVFSLALSEILGLSTGTPAWTLYPVHLRTIIETLALSEVIVRTSDVNRVVSESLALSESVQRLTIALRALSESLSLAGTLAKPDTTISRNVVETIGFTEALTRTLAFHRTITEIVGLSDEESHELLHRRLVLEAVSLTDSVTRNTTALRQLIENVVLSDAQYPLIIRNRQIAETIGFTTNAIRNGLYSLAVIEQLGLSDAATKQAILLRRLNDTLAASDAVLRAVINERGVVDDIGLSTSVQRYQLALRKITETLGLVDSDGQPASFVFPDAIWFLPTRSKAFKLSRKKAWTMPTRSKVFKLEAAA